MLSLKQKSAYSRINKLISVDSNESLIYFSGPMGSGKSKIVSYFIKYTLDTFENWAFYYIEGKDPMVESYSTITLPNLDKTKEYLLSNINLNLGFSIPQILNLGITTSLKKNNIFNDKINSILVELKNNTNKNIVIIADSFQLWDAASQEFLNTIINYPDLIKDKRVIILVIVDEDDSNINNCKYINNIKKKSHNFNIEILKKDELKEISKILGYNIELTTEIKEIIMSLTGGNISFIKMFLEEYTSLRLDNFSMNFENIEIMNLLDSRMDQFGEKKDDFLNVLKVSSILKGEFSSNEIKYLYPKEGDIENILDESKKASILKGEIEFMFSNYLVKNLFYKKLNGKSPIFHKKYAEYLKEYKPENYLSRAYNLQLAKTNDNIEIINLLAIAYCRSIENNNNSFEYNPIFNHIEKIKNDSVGNRYLLELYNSFINLKSAYEYFYKEMYNEANKELLKIPPIGPLLFTSEVARLHLIVKSLLDMDTENIYEAANDLSVKIKELYEYEKDQWCRCALVLFSTYSNKLNDYNSSKEFYDQLEKLISKDYSNSSLQHLKNMIYRKACIVKKPVEAPNSTASSIKYFYEIGDMYQYYLSCCNHSGNLIILGRHDEALCSLRNCTDVIKKYEFIKFPNQQKIYTNIYLANFLREYHSGNISKKNIISIKEKFENLINDQSSESNAITYINLINICIILNDYDECFAKLSILENDILYNNDDNFYKYYLCNIKFAINVLKQNWDEASKNLNELKNTFPNYFTKIERKIKNRNTALELLYNNKIILSPTKLDEWVYTNSKKEDDSCKFFCRLFLFSDLQFTSL